MKKMTTIFAIAALTLMLATTAFGQNEQKNPRVSRGGNGSRKNISFNFDKMNKGTNRQRLTGTEGSHWPRLEPQAQRRAASPKGFDKGYLSPGLTQRRRK